MRIPLRPKLQAFLALGVLVSSVAAPAGAVAKQTLPRLQIEVTPLEFAARIKYQVHLPAQDVTAQRCSVEGPAGSQAMACDTSPDRGSGRTLTKYSVMLPTTVAGAYAVRIEVDVRGGSTLVEEASWTAAPGPAVRFDVTGLEYQELACHIGPDCDAWPPPDFPRQVARVTALDRHGNVATGYAGTVSFKHPLTGETPDGLIDSTLTDGIGYFPVLVPSLGVHVDEDPFLTHCPGVSNFVLTATDTANPSIFGCQYVPGSTFTVILAVTGYEERPTPECETGCYVDPTETIVVDPRIFAPYIGTPVIAPEQPLELVGFTVSGQYFKQELVYGQLSVSGDQIDPDLLSLCGLCTPTMDFYVGEADTLVTGGATTFGPSGLTVTSYVDTAQLLNLTYIHSLPAPDPGSGSGEPQPVWQEVNIVLSSNDARGYEPPECYDNLNMFAQVVCFDLGEPLP